MIKRCVTVLAWGKKASPNTFKREKTMTTQATLDRQVKASHRTYNGFWVKCMGNYESNAFQSPDDNRSYQVSITKECGRWFVFGEDHEPSDIVNQPTNGFRTLTEAKEFANDFGSWFESCWNECNEIEKPLTIDELIDLQISALKGSQTAIKALLEL